MRPSIQWASANTYRRTNGASWLTGPVVKRVSIIQLNFLCHVKTYKEI